MHLPSITCSAVVEEQRGILFKSHSSCRGNNLCRSARQLPGCGAFSATSAEPGNNADVRLYEGLLEDNAEAMSISKSQEGGNFYKG